MPRKERREEQAVAVLQLVESGAKVAEVCRKARICEATFYDWKNQHAELGVSELRELRQMRDENPSADGLKRRVADLSLDQQILQEIVSKTLRGLGCDGSWLSGPRKFTGSANVVRRS